MRDNPGKQSCRGERPDPDKPNVLDVKRKLGSESKMHRKRYNPHTHPRMLTMMLEFARPGADKWVDQPNSGATYLLRSHIREVYCPQ